MYFEHALVCLSCFWPLAKCVWCSRACFAVRFLRYKIEKRLRAVKYGVDLISMIALNITLWIFICSIGGFEEFDDNDDGRPCQWDRTSWDSPSALGIEETPILRPALDSVGNMQSARCAWLSNRGASKLVAASPQRPMHCYLSLALDKVHW